MSWRDGIASAGRKVVLGGLHVLSCPEEAAPHADALAIGEGVQLWPRILRDVEAGTLEPVYRGSYRRPYREDPPPRRDLLPRRSLPDHHEPDRHPRLPQPLRLLLPGDRGAAMPYQVRDVEQVVAEFAADGQPYAVFIDNNLGSRPEYLRSLCRALRPLEMIWSAAVTIDVTDDPSLVRDMALAGCTGVFVGFESLADANLAEARKKTPQHGGLRPARGAAPRPRHPGQRQLRPGLRPRPQDVFERTVDWIEENRLECATFHILTPYPGTPLFRQMEAEGRLLHKDWSLYDTAHVVFRPRHMTPEELAEGYAWCYERLFSHASIWRRRPADWRRGPPLPGDVVPLQAVEPALAPPHPPGSPTPSGAARRVTRRRHLRFRRRLARGVIPPGAELSTPAPWSRRGFDPRGPPRASPDQRRGRRRAAVAERLQVWVRHVAVAGHGQPPGICNGLGEQTWRGGGGSDWALDSGPSSRDDGPVHPRRKLVLGCVRTRSCRRTPDRWCRPRWHGRSSCPTRSR